MKSRDSWQPSLRNVAQAYDQRFSAGGFRESESFYRWVVRRLALHRRSRLLDMSCGEGHLLARASDVEGTELFGIDISTVALQISTAHVPCAFLSRCDGVALPFPASSFDYVTNLGSLEHYSDVAAGVAEIRRVLRPGGRAAILLPNSYYLGDIIWWVWRTGYGPSHKQVLERFATSGEWRDLLESGGLEVLHIHPYNIRSPWTRADWQWYSARPTRLLSLLFSPMARGNLAYGFLFIARKPF